MLCWIGIHGRSTWQLLLRQLVLACAAELVARGLLDDAPRVPVDPKHCFDHLLPRISWTGALQASHFQGLQGGMSSVVYCRRKNGRVWKCGISAEYENESNLSHDLATQDHFSISPSLSLWSSRESAVYVLGTFRRDSLRCKAAVGLCSSATRPLRARPT
jgi:hypothetical protein